MLPPRKLKQAAAKNEVKNIKFRTYLKMHADPEELDRQCADLHRKLFAKYDCSRCRNCCKEYSCEISPDELPDAAEHLQMTQEEFIDKYLDKHQDGQVYISKHVPCDFLTGAGECILAACQPDSCVKYPYTDQSDRMESLLGLLESIEVCPVACEIWEQLKILYHFR